MKLTLKTLPISTNRLYRGRRFLTKEGKENKEALSWEARVEWGKSMPLRGPVSLVVKIYWPNARNHDLDNLKGLFDSLSGILYDDDSQIYDLHLHKSVDKENPRVELEIASIVL